MSRVYKALDHETGRTVCLKVQIREKNAAAAARASREEPRPPEGEIAIQVVHPHVVRTLEYGDTTNGEHYLVMEFIDGHQLPVRPTSRRLGARRRRSSGWPRPPRGWPRSMRPDSSTTTSTRGTSCSTREHQVKLIDFGLAIPNTPAFRGPGNRTGHAPVHGPRADPPRADRRTDRHLRLRRPRLRVADRSAPLRRRRTPRR